MERRGGGDRERLRELDRDDERRRRALLYGDLDHDRRVCVGERDRRC
jgi:hypothetical protein